MVAEAAAAKKQQRCHGGGGGGRHGGRGGGGNSSGGINRGSGGNKGSGDNKGSEGNRGSRGNRESGGNDGNSCGMATGSIVVLWYYVHDNFFLQIHFLRSILRRPHIDRISEGVLKIFRRNRNHDSCEKIATGTENTGIRRIPAGIGNLGH